MHPEYPKWKGFLEGWIWSSDHLCHFINQVLSLCLTKWNTVSPLNSYSSLSKGRFSFLKFHFSVLFWNYMVLSPLPHSRSTLTLLAFKSLPLNGVSYLLHQIINSWKSVLYHVSEFSDTQHTGKWQVIKTLYLNIHGKHKYRSQLAL